jgi:hypothetical protein
LVAVAALGMYGLVLAANRYIAPFVVLLWTGLLLSVRLNSLPATGRWLAVSGGALVFSLAVNIAAFHLDGLNAIVGFVPRTTRTVSTGKMAWGKPSSVAQGLLDLGLEEGDRVGFIGYSFDAYWARLARLKIVAEIVPKEADDFWSSDSTRQNEVLRMFSSLGVGAVVAERLPRDDPMPSGWTKVGQTGFYAYLMP